MRSYSIRVGRKSNVWYHDKKAMCEDTEMHKGEGHVKTEALIGAIWLQVEDCWQAPETMREARKGFFPQKPKRKPTLFTP